MKFLLRLVNIGGGGEEVIYIRCSLFYSTLRLFYLVAVHVFFDKTYIIGMFYAEDTLNFWPLKKVLK